MTRTIPAELVRQYQAEGWWTADTMGDTLARGLAAAPATRFRVHSAVRPWQGTFADVELTARRLAAGFRERGVQPGDVVAFQLPNWMEAAAVFWASAMLGTVTVPIVHFYGRKEVSYILRSTTPKVFVTAAKFGRLEYQPDLSAGVPIVGVVGENFGELLAADPMPNTVPADPAQPALIAFTSGTTAHGITVYRSYGSTEHPSVTGSHLIAPERKRLYTDGVPLTGVEVRLRDDGEILSRGPHLCLGYTDPELTARVFDDEGWYHTGDTGVLDEDGYLTITGRKSDMIIRGGENISALEVEDLLLGIDGVAEVAVVAAPDTRLGEHAAAVLRMREGRQPPTMEQVRDHLHLAGLARQKWPEEIHAVADFPRTASGKVQKYVLRRDIATRQT